MRADVFFEKLARVFGDSVDYGTTTARDIPISDRMAEFKRYHKSKAKEQPTDPGKATLVGGGIGAGLGLLAGSAGGSKGALLGATLFGLTGAAVGYLAHLSDKEAIEEARRISKLPPAKQAKEARKAAVQALADRDRSDRAREDRRHSELMSALRDSRRDSYSSDDRLKHRLAFGHDFMDRMDLAEQRDRERAARLRDEARGSKPLFELRYDF